MARAHTPTHGVASCGGAAKKQHEELPVTFYTVGHSSHELGRFIDLVSCVGIQCIADVRRFPRSRSNPQFNLERLSEQLPNFGIGYRHMEALGGRRPAKRTSASPNDFWTHPSFRAYADYALTPPFVEGLADLRALGRTTTVAIMCSEAVWWRCHRRILADYLLTAGESVVHLMGKNKAVPAEITPSAVRRDTSLIYPETCDVAGAQSACVYCVRLTAVQANGADAMTQPPPQLPIVSGCEGPHALQAASLQPTDMDTVPAAMSHPK